MATLDPKAIGDRAHQIWISRGRREGHALEDWLQAERELGSVRTSPPPAASPAPAPKPAAALKPAGAVVPPAASVPLVPGTKPPAPAGGKGSNKKRR
jgi:hypothetical protein